MSSYVAYGLSIRSEVPLPLPSGCRAGDVDVRLRSLDAELADLRKEGREYSFDLGEARFYWGDIGGFVARGGREILVDPAPGGTDEDVQLGVLGPALVSILFQRGFLLLHGSVVEIDGVAVAFLGRSGWGKSTMAAALRSCGHPMLTDDVVAVRLDDGGPVVFPGMPHFKLWPDSAEAVGARPDELPEVAPGFQKRVMGVDEGWSSEPVRLGRIHVLAFGEQMAVEPLPVRDAFLELANHSLAVRWFLRRTNESQFAERARLVQQVRVSRLRRPRDLTRLGEVARLVERDLRHA